MRASATEAEKVFIFLPGKYLVYRISEPCLENIHSGPLPKSVAKAARVSSSLARPSKGENSPVWKST